MSTFTPYFRTTKEPSTPRIIYTCMIAKRHVSNTVSYNELRNRVLVLTSYEKSRGRISNRILRSLASRLLFVTAYRAAFPNLGRGNYGTRINSRNPTRVRQQTMLQSLRGVTATLSGGDGQKSSRSPKNSTGFDSTVLDKDRSLKRK